jgi:oligopeptide/dipeptide ABC transporter ATP-binding protein
MSDPSTATRPAVPKDSVPLVQTRELKVHFKIGGGDTLRAVDGVDLEVQSGEVLGVIGESGSGKSTLGRAIVALQDPTAGEVSLEGHFLSTMKRSERRKIRRDFQIIFQDPAGALNPRRTVLQSVREPVYIEGGKSRAEQDQIALDCLSTVGLGPEYGSRYPHELSGGQKQRVNIARVLTMRPKLIVCDEAVAALDVSIQAEIINLFARLQRELGLAYVFISHDLSVVAHVSHLIAVMYLGRVVEIGQVEQIMADPLHPYTKALLWSRPVPIPAALRSTTRQTLEGEIPSPISPPSGCRFRTRCPHAQPVCAEEEPLLLEGSARHRVACHFAMELREEAETSVPNREETGNDARHHS